MGVLYMPTTIRLKNNYNKKLCNDFFVEIRPTSTHFVEGYKYLIEIEQQGEWLPFIFAEIKKVQKQIPLHAIADELLMVAIGTDANIARAMLFDNFNIELFDVITFKEIKQ